MESSHITPDIFRRAKIVAVTQDENGCTSAEVQLDGVDEETVFAAVPPEAGPGVTVVLYTIGDVTDDHPLSLEIPSVIAGTITAFKTKGPNVNASDVISLKVNDVIETSAAPGTGWQDCNIPITTGDGMKPVVSTLAGTGACLCYIRINRGGAGALEVGSWVHVQKTAHRQGGHGRWRVASNATGPGGTGGVMDGGTP